MANISSVRLIELEQIEKRLKELETAKLLEEPINKFLNNIGIILANTPKEQWPIIANIALNDAFKHYDKDLKIAYINRLPK
jgi:hypothetical protein